MIRRAIMVACAMGMAPLLGGGCSLEDLSGLLPMMSEDLVNPSTRVSTLDAIEVQGVLTEVVTRYRLLNEVPAEDEPVTWLSLHGGAMPLDQLLGDQAMGVCASIGGPGLMSIDVACTFGLPASGSVGLSHSVLSTSPHEVTELQFEYRDVRVGSFDVDGVESILTSDAPGSPMIFTLDLVQDGHVLDYLTRMGFTDDGMPAFDFEVTIAGDPAQVRLTIPSTIGGLLTATISGVDGALVCDVRNAAWEPGESVKGTCDNGLVFGLP